MSTVLVTGGSGLIGRSLINKLLTSGLTVISISRQNPGTTVHRPNFYQIHGDILEPNLGITYDGQTRDFPRWVDAESVDSVYHLAGIINLSKNDKGGTIWETNFTGTRNVIRFCLDHNVPHLYYCGTAYTLGRNPYEKSKAAAEALVNASVIPHKTVFKPGIVLGPPDRSHLEHLPQFAMIMAQVHKRADIVRHNIEGTLHLPVLEPVFHMKGNSGGSLNVVPLDSVVDAIANIKSDGTFWLTHDCPPTVGEVAGWIGEALFLKVVVACEFNATPVEIAFQKLASAFMPYLEGDDFPSHAPELFTCPKITKDIITDMVNKSLVQ